MRRVRVLVVDDHLMLREALVGMLEASGFEVVGAVADGADATALAPELVPDVILIDLSMPVLNGLDATRLLREVVPATAIVVFSAFDNPDLKRQVFDAGAVAYLPKGCSNARLRATLEAAVTVAGSNLRRTGSALGPQRKPAPAGRRCGTVGREGPASPVPC